MATCVELSGASYPWEFHGNVIRPWKAAAWYRLSTARPIRRDAIFWEHEGNRAIRSGKWKLVAKGPRGPWELYDMEKDRTEMHDLAAARPERTQAIARLWEAWAKRTMAIPWPWGAPYGAKTRHQP